MRLTACSSLLSLYCDVLLMLCFKHSSVLDVVESIVRNRLILFFTIFIVILSLLRCCDVIGLYEVVLCRVFQFWVFHQGGHDPLRLLPLWLEEPESLASVDFVLLR